MQKTLSKIFLSIFFLLFAFNTVNAAPFLVQQGGTGVGTITGIPYGIGTSPLGVVTIGSGLSFAGGTLSALGSGTVTSVSVNSANGFAGSSSGGATPALTLRTTLMDGSIPFASTNAFMEDNDNFSWDNTNKSLTIGSPTSVLNGLPENALNVNGDFGGVGDPDFLAISNHNSSPYGSTDHVVSNDADDGSVLTGTYGDLGIAGSNYQNSGDPFTRSNDVYLLSSKGAGNLNIAAQGTGKKIRFATAGDTADQLRMDIADDKMTIYANKDVEIVPALTGGNWTAAGGWSVTGGHLVETSNAGPNTIRPATPLSITAGITYRVIITASATSGAISYTLGGESGSAITATTITDFVTATTTGNLIITGAASSTATITAVSIRALVPNTGDLFIEGNLKFGSSIQTTSGADILSADGLGVATFAQIPMLPAVDPTDDNEAARKAYVDSVAVGLTPIASCRLATTVAGTLATSFENGDTIDGVALVTGNRLLIKNQVAAAENGIYIVAASGAPTRATDYDTSPEVKQGTFTFISAGSTQAGQQWVQLTSNPTINVSPLVFSLLSSTPIYTASNGVQLVGSDFSAKLSATGAVTLTGAGSDELTVNVDNSSIERSGNAIRVKALGITNAMLAGSIAASKLADTYVQPASTDTLTNKRIQPRSSTAASGDITPALATANLWQRTAQAAAVTINAPTGTPVLGEVLVFMILDNGTARAITWNSAFTTRVMSAALPTTTTISKQLLVTCQYNGTTWLCLSSSET